jgi:Integrase core domain
VDRKIVELLIQGKTGRYIKETLKIGWKRFARVKAQAEEFGYINGGKPLPPFPESLFPDPVDKRTLKKSDPDILLLEKKDWITDHLQGGWRPVTVWEEIGVSVTKSSFYRFLHRHGLFDTGRAYRVIPEIVHKPGEALQLDWGKFRDVIDENGKKKTLWAFVGVLGYSRYTMVRLVWTNDIPTTLAAIESMFKELGGVPQRITSDNPKCFVIEASNYEPILNPAFERFSNHYNFVIECLPPRDPQKKGKVERQMSFIRRLYEAHGPNWFGVEESQSYMDKKLSIANERKHGTTQRRPIDDLLQVELNFLKSLPAVSYQMEDFGEGKIRRDGHVRFLNKYYSVDEAHISQEVFIIGSQTQVNIYLKGKLIEVHERLTDPTRVKQTKKHHLKPWEQSMQEDSFYRKKAGAIGPDVERMIIILIAQGLGFIDTRKIWGILSLEKKFEKDSINAACRKAIDLQSYSYQTVLSLLRLQVRAVPEEKFTKKIEKPNKFARPISEYAAQLKLKLH